MNLLNKEGFDMKKNKIGTRYLAGVFFIIYAIIAFSLNFDSTIKNYIALGMFIILFVADKFIFKNSEE